MKINKHRIILGAGLSFFSLILGITFHFKFVIPAYTRLANGNFGEMYGPVSCFRIPFYTLCGIFFFLGTLLCLFDMFEKKQNQEVD